MLALGAVLFAFQIYGDFSGYSDIAIGTARLFGFDIMRNFAYPYFSRDIAEFWRRWHIFPVIVVQRLCLHSPRRQSLQWVEGTEECVDHLSG